MSIPPRHPVTTSVRSIREILDLTRGKTTECFETFSNVVNSHLNIIQEAKKTFKLECIFYLFNYLVNNVSLMRKNREFSVMIEDRFLGFLNNEGFNEVREYLKILFPSKYGKNFPGKFIFDRMEIIKSMRDANSTPDEQATHFSSNLYANIKTGEYPHPPELILPLKVKTLEKNETKIIPRNLPLVESSKPWKPEMKIYGNDGSAIYEDGFVCPPPSIYHFHCTRQSCENEVANNKKLELPIQEEEPYIPHPPPNSPNTILASYNKSEVGSGVILTDYSPPSVDEVREVHLEMLSCGIWEIAFEIKEMLNAQGSRNVKAFQLCDSILNKCDEGGTNNMKQVVTLCDTLLQMKILSPWLVKKFDMKQVPSLINHEQSSCLKRYVDMAKEIC